MVVVVVVVGERVVRDGTLDEGAPRDKQSPALSDQLDTARNTIAIPRSRDLMVIGFTYLEYIERDV